jgi:hypothetical protein
MKAKYQPLQDFLSGLPRSQATVTLSFQEIEKLIGGKLPPSAYHHRAWWSNQADVCNRPQAKAWRHAGFQVESVNPDRKDGLVSFRR